MKFDRIYRIKGIVDLIQESNGKELPKKYVKWDKVGAWCIGVGAVLFWAWVIVRIYGN